MKGTRDPKAKVHAPTTKPQDVEAPELETIHEDGSAVPQESKREADTTPSSVQEDTLPDINLKVNASHHIGFDSTANPATVIRRASLFLLESVGEGEENVPEDVDEEKEDPFLDLFHSSLEPKRGTIQHFRWLIKKLISNIFFRLCFALLIITDVAVITVDLATEDMDGNVYFIQTSFICSCFFVIEIFLRSIGFGLYTMVHVWYNVLDVCIIIASTIGATYIFIDRYVSGKDYFSTHHRTTFWYFLFILRFCRLAYFFRLYHETEMIKRAARLLVSQNKRRYHADGFDLDLTYVTDRVIAMSFPSSGHMTFYRNPIREVARFFQTKHKDHYKIYNLCKEREYDERIFGGQVERFHIADHNVPTCKEMLDFAATSSEWLAQDEKNVIAVHCKGGKGRTGTMICVYLVDNGLFSTAEDSLSFFGSRRTDLTQGTNFQGVETPSQCRYVGYYEAIRNHHHKLPKEVEMTLRSIRIWGLKSVGRGDGSDITLLIESPMQGKVYENHFGKGSLSMYDKEEDELFTTFQAVPSFQGDIRFKFKCSSHRVPRGYENTAWFFWFHTGFIKHNRLKLERSELDNPHKNKTWDIFRENFCVECLFQKIGKPGASAKGRQSGRGQRLSMFISNKVRPDKKQ